MEDKNETRPIIATATVEQLPDARARRCGRCAQIRCASRKAITQQTNGIPLIGFLRFWILQVIIQAMIVE